LSDLAKVLDLLASYETKTDKYRSGYYILIDRLDEKWVDDSVRYQLIKALIECLKSMRKIRDLKIIVSIREDVLEKVIQNNDDPGFQREKYYDYAVKVRWSEEDLRKIINRRINHLFKSQYSSENIFFEDIFDEKVGTVPTISYLFKRTLMRPRDAIAFVNECLELSSERSAVSQRIVRRAEREYSRMRLNALTDEWRSTFPSLKHVFRLITDQAPAFNPADEFWSEAFIDDLSLSITAHDEQQEADSIYLRANEAFASGSTASKHALVREVLSILYRIGAVGLKMHPSDPYWYSFKATPVVEPSNISVGTKVQVHEMLQSALNLKPIKASAAE